jgi:hypothetical protein
MQITLSIQQSKLLEALYQQGRYKSLEDTIDIALLLLADEISQHHSDDTLDYLDWVEQTRLKIDEGIQLAEQDRFLDADDVMVRLRQKVNNAKAVSE